LGRQVGDVRAVEDHRSAGGFHQPQDGPPEGGLATTGFAGQTVGLTALDGQRDAVDGVHVADHLVEDDALADREVHLDVVDLQKHLRILRGGGQLGGGQIRQRFGLVLAPLHPVGRDLGRGVRRRRVRVDDDRVLPRRPGRHDGSSVSSMPAAAGDHRVVAALQVIARRLRGGLQRRGDLPAPFDLPRAPRGERTPADPRDVVGDRTHDRRQPLPGPASSRGMDASSPCV
jgi:hypothetical protein